MKIAAADSHRNLEALDAQRDWMSNLPATYWLREDVLLVHGTARSDEEYFLETVTEQGSRAATAPEILDRGQAPQR